MNDKIIIDGVDVAECKYYHYKGCTANNFGKCDSNAELYKNCYFKQLKRLQEENEELKEKNKNYARLMLAQQEISQKYWECIGKIKQAIEVLAETCNVYPLKTNLDKLITTINEALNDRD